jgi:predicted  nucleic acid-binding Zn-ribbon protein
MSQPFKFYRLQQIDTQLDRLRGRLSEISIALQDRAQVDEAEQKVKAADQVLQAVRKDLRRAEDNVKDQRIKIEQTEAALYGGKVRNPKELQDLQNEAAALKRYRAVLEDRQIELMVSEEEAALLYQAASSDLTAAAQADQKRQELFIQERSHIEKDIPPLEEERQAMAGSLTPEELNLYEQLRRQRRGLAVALVTNKACSACGSVLNSALLDAARSPSQITRCDSCGRILYLS